MKHWILSTAIVLGVLAYITSSAADQYVRGYMKRDGTYVSPHWRSSPNSSYNDNWSVRPNINPYTGQLGTRSPTFNDQSPYENRRDFGYPGYLGSPGN